MELINTPKSSNNNFIDRSYKTGTATAKSVLEKLKTLGSSYGINNNSNTGSDTSPLSNTSSTTNLSILWSLIRYTLVFLILGFIIINIMAKMKLLSPNLVKFFKPILIFNDYNLKKAEDTIADVNTSIQKDINELSDQLPSDQSIDQSPSDQSIDQLPSDQSIDKLFKKEEQEQSAPQPNETDTSKSYSKSGYCYIGIDRGFRSCVKVNEHETCMSGDIFPTHAICINPSLRP